MAEIFEVRTPAVEGYCGALSYLSGEDVTLHCSTRASYFSVEITRVGQGREVVWQQERVQGREQSVPDHAYAVGCGWPVSLRLTIPDSWRSGFYEVALIGEGVDKEKRDEAAVGHAFFVVRSAKPAATNGILLLLSTNTYNAYNRWGGHCLYTGATHVSFARPLEPGFLTRPHAAYDGRVAAIAPESDPEHHQLRAYLHAHKYPLWCASAGWHNWERRFVVWAEANGYRIDMAVNSDLDRYPDLLDGYQLMVSVGHDEYWSWAMRDAMDAFVERGGNLAIFSGNTACWQVRLADEGRTMVCYKGRAPDDDPIMQTEQRHLMTSSWSHPLLGRPENSTTGLSFTRGGYVRVGGGVPRSSGAYTIHRPAHWVFDGTDLYYGDLLGLGSTVVGYEVDGCEFTLHQGLPMPTGQDGTPENLTILATSPARLLSQTATYSEIPKAIWADPDGPGDLEGVATTLFGSASPENVARIAHGHAVMGIFPKGKGTVFNVGSTDWAYGLEQDRQIQQVTRNVLDRLSAKGQRQ